MIKKYIIYHSYIADLFHSLFKKLKEPCIDIICEFIPKGGVVVDIGANYGQFAAFAASLVGIRGKVYCFEPLLYPLMILNHMKFLRKYQQIVSFKTAVSDYTGNSMIAIPIEKGWKPKHALSYITNRREGNAIFERVPVIKLDDICQSLQLERLDFLKIDTEGSELNVLLGSEKTLLKYNPVIYCEIEKPYCDRRNINVNEIYYLLNKLGYKGYLPNNNCSLVRVDKYVRRANYFFIHPHSIKHFLKVL